MTSRHSAYAGARIALATMHGKAMALETPFARLGARLVASEDIDTDALGTFSGEVPRALPPLETAIAKARLAMRATGLPIGLATEGSFGPDPVVGMVPLHSEIAVLVDDTRGLIVSEQLHTHETNYAGRGLRADESLDDAQLQRWGFPEHALIVRSEPFAPGAAVRKGLTDCAALDRAIRECLAASPEVRVRVETDMRAHLNPTRMRNIAILGERLAERLSRDCVRCAAPGFGKTDVLAGLPCRDCGEATTSVRAEIHSCAVCGYREERPRGDGRIDVDPTYCDLCNP